MTKAKNDKFDYEKGVARLEEIVALFDEGAMTLDQMEASFMEGMELIKKCSERLNQVETRVNQLIEENQQGEWNEAPFDEDEQ